MRVLGTEPESSVRAIRILTMELSLWSLYCFSKNNKKDVVLHMLLVMGLRDALSSAAADP